MDDSNTDHTATEDRQLQQVRATLARLEAGTLTTIPGEQVVSALLARGRLTETALDEAHGRLGVPGASGSQ